MLVLAMPTVQQQKPLVMKTAQQASSSSPLEQQAHMSRLSGLEFLKGEQVHDKPVHCAVNSAGCWTFHLLPS